MADKDLTIHIKSSVEIAALKQMEAALEQQIAKARVLGKSYADLVPQLTAVRTRLSEFSVGDKLGGEVRGLLDKIPGLSTALDAMSGAMGPIAVGAAAIAGGLKLASDAVKEFAAAEVSVAKLDAALANVGELTDANREKLQDLAQQLQVTTGVADDQWYGVLERLIKTGKVEVDQLEKHTTAVKNLAGLMGGDVQTASMLYTRALNGNFMALARYGINVKDAGTATEKLAELQRQAAARGAGVLEAQINTLTGKMISAKNASADFLKNLGNWLTDALALRPIMQGVGDSLGYWAEKLNKVVPQVEGLDNKLKKANEEFPLATGHLAELDKITKAVATSTEEAAKAFDKEATALDATTKALLEQLQAQKRLQLARIEASDLSPEDKAVARGKLTAGGSAAEFAVQQQAALAKMALLDKANAKDQAELAATQSAIYEQETRVGTAQKLDDKDATIRRRMQGFKKDQAALPDFSLAERIAAAEGRPVEDRMTVDDLAKYERTKAAKKLLEQAIAKEEQKLAANQQDRELQKVGTATQEESRVKPLQEALQKRRTDVEQAAAEREKQKAALQTEIDSRAAQRPLEIQTEEVENKAAQEKAVIAKRKLEFQKEQARRANDLASITAKGVQTREQEERLILESVKAEADELAQQAAENPVQRAQLEQERRKVFIEGARKLSDLRKKYAELYAKESNEEAIVPLSSTTAAEVEQQLYKPMSQPAPPRYSESADEERGRRRRTGTWTDSDEERFRQRNPQEQEEQPGSRYTPPATLPVPQEVSLQTQPLDTTAIAAALAQSGAANQEALNLLLAAAQVNTAKIESALAQIKGLRNA